MRLAVFTAALAACYSPRTPDACSISCSDNTECPTGLSCNGVVCTDGDSCPGDGPSATEVCAGSVTTPLGRICFDSQPEELPIASDTALDTNLPDCQKTVANMTVCVLPVSSIAQDVTLTVTGPHPLVLWSSGVIQIVGTIDGSSNGTGKGPGANPSTCAMGVPPG